MSSRRVDRHELMTPLTGVRALLQSLAAGTIPDGEQSRLIEQGLVACERLRLGVEGLLAGGPEGDR